MRKDDPLSKHEFITPDLLMDIPLIISKKAYLTNELSGCLDDDIENHHIIATFNLINNTALLAEEGLGYVVSLDKIIQVSDDSPLCFCPLEPKLEATLSLVWRQSAKLSPAASKLLEIFRQL